MSLAAAFYSPKLNFSVASGYTDAGAERTHPTEPVERCLKGRVESDWRVHNANLICFRFWEVPRPPATK